MYKVIAADLDGTLLKNDKSISQATIDQLKRTSEKGVLFLPSTGRTHKELPQAIRNLPFLRYALCCNGGALYDYKEDAYIYENGIPYDLALKVLDYVKTLPVYETIIINGERIGKGDENNNLCDYIKKTAVKGILFNIRGAYDVKKAYAEKHMDAQKLLLYPNENGNIKEIMETLQKQFPELSVSSSGPKFIEVNIQGVDKGKALNNFCQLMNIPIEDSIAFGDAENDISMLDAAGFAVVMANGTQTTKKHADMICPSNEEDGVAEALIKLIP